MSHRRFLPRALGVAAAAALAAGPAQSLPAQSLPAQSLPAQLLPVHAQAQVQTARVRPATTTADHMSATFTDRAGTRSTYHLFRSKVTTAKPVGLVVYLDGDGMYGHRNYTSTWALGGSRGVVAQAAARGYATLSILTPDRRGTATFWEDGRVNAAYVAELTSRIRTELGVQKTWFVGYSGGSQLITQYLLPGHADLMADGGGAVITGGGGRPYRGGQQSLSTVSAATKAGFPMLWYTGSLDDGRGTDDGYDALADAKSGHAWYAERGFRATRQQPAGLDHSDLGTRFGTVLAGQLDAHRAQVTRARR